MTATSPTAAPSPQHQRGAIRTGAPVAVCIPVYQGERHLAETLRSVLGQTLRDVEVVVLDNASTDATPRILAGVDDPRVALWRNPRTVSMAENFNRVVGLSHAPLVKILPADDLLEPDCLELQVAALEADPSLVLVAGRSHLVDDDGRMMAHARFLRGLLGRVERDEVVRRVVRHGANPIGGEVATMFRRRAFDAAGGYQENGLHTDIGMWLRLLEHGRFGGIALPVARFRIAGGTCSAEAGREDYRAQRRFTRQVAATAGAAVSGRDRAWSRVSAPLARRRRELLFAVNRLRRHEPGPRPRPDLGASAVARVRGA